MYFIRENEIERNEGSKMPIKDRGTYREIFEVEGCDISNYLLLPKQDALQTPKPIIRDSKPNDLKIIDEYDFIKVNIKLSFNQMKINLHQTFW